MTPPRRRLVELLLAIMAMAGAYGLRYANAFHLGDGSIQR
jgi:hypothetical protein